MPVFTGFRGDFRTYEKIGLHRYAIGTQRIKKPA